ncbi:MAG: hypothetical protein J5671_01655 [Bacteroidaceae bacterium]|nr:hypothetical protein [Bacteroidaceae bacterium]
MKRTKTLLCALLMGCMATWAAEPWKLHLFNDAEEIEMHIDLYEETIDVPGMAMFGPMNGYLGGKGIYGKWMVTSFVIKDDHAATLRVSNDLGSETQSVLLTWQNDSTYAMDLQGGVVVKKVVNRKLVKIPARVLLKVKR